VARKVIGLRFFLNLFHFAIQPVASGHEVAVRYAERSASADKGF
jgi:hypothetical protein